MYNPLIILMWKHFTVRLRRYIQTPIELVSPILLFVLFFAIKDVILSPPSRHAQEDNNIKHTEEYILEPLLGPSVIIYTPETEHTARLMDEVGREMNIPRLETFPAADREIRGYYGFTNDTSVEDFIKKMKESQAIVIFQDMVDSFPERLNYTIRMKVDFMTEVYESLDDDYGPHERFGTIYESFVRLQWAIDKSYLQMRTGVMINQTISLQEFPYVESRRNVQAEAVGAMMQAACFLGLLIPFVFLMARLLEERATGVQELTKMAGVSAPTLAVSHFLNAAPAGLVYAALGAALLKASAAPLVPESNGFLIFLMLALHFLTVAAMAFVCSFLTKRNQYVVSLGILAYVVLWLPVHLLEGVRLGRLAARLAGLLPHAPMYWFWREVVALEKYGDGVDFSTWAKSHSERSGSVLECYLLMALQTGALAAAAWYLSLVCPGPHGTARPWNFCWKKKVSPDPLVSEQDEPMVRDPQFFEEPPANKEVGIKIANVDKIYDKDRVLTNVTFDVYKGEITVLLGHNGAGKTTLMSIITGMVSASEGKVYVNGLEAAAHQTEVRKQLGLCTQHNLFFAELTVLEHVMFFSMLKGRTYGEARKAGRELLSELGVEGKAGARSGELSGGMQRRLQLACALAGGADVLVLDEPTSGLDVETRRELWDLLLSLRGKRTVLLTTHFMEEADALGDRVAALHRGVLRCHATPMHLKKHIGTGYRLSLVTRGPPRQAELTAAVTAQLPAATLREAGPNSASFNLPAAASSQFPHLFRDLEARKLELGIDSIGVGMPTLEEVFLKLCSNVGTSLTEDDTDAGVPEPTYVRLTGPGLYRRQVSALITRHVRFILSTKMSFLILQVILPILFIFLFTYALNLDPNEVRAPEHLELDLNLYSKMHERKVLYDVDDTEALRGLQEHYKNVEFVPTSDVAGAILRTGHKDMSEYIKYLAGIQLNDTNAKVLYTTVVRHAAPVGLNVLSNVLAAQAVPWADGRTVATYNHPVGRARALLHDVRLVEPKDLMAITTWAMLFLIIYLSTIANASALACKEAAAGTRHVHVMAGCAPAAYWLARLLVHALLYAAALVAPALVALKLFETHATLDQPDALGTIFLILTLGLLAWLAFIYLLSFHLGESAISGVLAIILIFGVIAACIQTMYALLGTSMGAVPRALLAACQHVLPPHTLTAAMLKAGNVARLNAYCALNREKCSPMLYAVQGLDVDKCCVAKVNPADYFEFKDDYPAREMIILFVQAIVYMVLVIVTEHGLFSGLHDAVWNRAYGARAQAPADDAMVRAETTYVTKAISMPKDQITDAMLVNDIHKNYFHLFKKSCNAVKGVSFSVKKGECFGLLGVNGAGKSTTFKMVVAETAATRGRLFANGHHLQCPRERYLHTLGYCPQFFGLDEFLTGEQNLALVLTLRGLPARDVAAQVHAWIQVVGLERYKDIAVSRYSGGCKRRMATAAALCGGAPLTLLDEPTSGVDVSARRRVWAALRRALRHDRALILTSHSMDEMEALCGRIAIMSGGAVVAAGAPAELRAAHAAGHAVVLKVGSPLPPEGTRTEVDGVVPILSLKNAIKAKFNCTLKDEHKTMLHYHINETMPYSELFARLEELKASHGALVEDYAVTETTLEEVFLSFAHGAHKRKEHV